MERRRLLTTLGVGIGALGGYLGESGVSPDRTRFTTDSDVSDTQTSAFDPEGLTETIRIGENPGEINPHGVVVWNALESSARVHVRVFDSAASETRHERSYDLPSDIAVAISLRKPSRYRIALRVPDVDAQRTISVPDRLFDTCNESYTHASVRPTGLTERTMTTELDCGTTTDDRSSGQASDAIE